MSENASAWADLTGRTLTKGQGTGNDFIFITDPKAEAVLDADLVARVCDRHFGLGADGFIRAAHTETFSTGQKILEKHPEATWFMDYRNADGTISEMCGNGVRAFVEYLRTEGLISLEVGEHVSIGTRAGVKTVARTDTGYAVDMGPWSFIHGDAAREGGEDSQVSARGLKTPRPALSISMGNPHTVVMLGSDGKLDGLDLGVAPVITPAPENGTNVEFVVPLELEHEPGDTGVSGEQSEVGAIRLRVHERGVGETLSYGAGCCAVAVALHAWTGPGAPEDYRLLVPGGEIGVHVGASPLGEDSTVLLTGPATITGRVTIA